jgi:DNA-binding CsgD family transcriptional regulator
MAKVTAMRSSSASKRVPAVIAAATRFSATKSAERRPDLLAMDVLAALEAALEAMPIPTFIADRRGTIVCSNAAARAVIGGEPTMTPLSAPANNVGFSPRRWEVTPIRGVGSAWSLVILRSPDLLPRRRWNLTTRQSEVLHLVVQGLTNTGIAETLGIRLGTVEFHISAIFDKIGVNSRAVLIATVMGDGR